MKDIILERGLPASADVERFVLGWLMESSSNDQFASARQIIRTNDFSTEKHRTLFRVMQELDDSGKRIERQRIAEELIRIGKLESVDGITGLVSLTDGIPRIPDITGYLAIIREKSILRQTINACQVTINECLLATDDSTDIVGRAVAQLSGLYTAAEDSRKWFTPGQVIEAIPGGVQELITPKPGAGGIPLPWPPIDQLICGMQKGQMIVIAARPGMGKSAAGLQIATHAALNGYEPAMLSMEVKKEAITKRLLSQMAYVDSQKMRAGFLNADERSKILRAATRLSPLPFWIDDTRNQTAESIRLSLKRRKQEGKIDLIIIDHFHLVKGSPREETRERFNRIADTFQDMGGEFDCPVVVLAQLSRKCEDENRMPGLTDLKETGKLEENADVALMIHRPEMYAKNRSREEYKGVAQFVMAKQRDGATGSTEMVWIASCQRFETRAEDFPEGRIDWSQRYDR